MSLAFSVVIPFYYQFDQLKKTLEYFGHQVFPHDLFEVIVVNDGTEGFSEEAVKGCVNDLNLRTITIDHSGSGAARNAGVQIARGDYIVFCDADRIPDVTFLEDYSTAIQNFPDMNCVFQGRVQECYAIDPYECDNRSLARFSRDNQYYKKIMSIYDGDSTNSSIRWASFMVGNSCVPRELFEKLGGFDPQFDVWGFEHFDLAVRMMDLNVRFVSADKAKNYHIPHSKSKEEYISLFKKSAQIMNAKYERYNGKFNLLVQYLCGELSLQQFEILFSGEASQTPASQPEIFYQL